MPNQRNHRNGRSVQIGPTMRAMSDPAESSGREILEGAVRGAGSPPPYVRLLGMRFIAVSDGSATFEMPARKDLYNPNNVVHGGALPALAHTAMGFAVSRTLPPGAPSPPRSLHTPSRRNPPPPPLTIPPTRPSGPRGP